MITPRNVTDSSCNSCGGTKRVVEFKIGRGTTEARPSTSSDGGGLLVRLCSDCRQGLGRHLQRALEADDMDLIERSKIRSACKATGYNGLLCTCGGLRCGFWLGARHAGTPCVLPSGHPGDHAPHAHVGPDDLKANPSFRINHRGTRKKPAATRKTRKKAGGIGARGSKARTKR